MPTLDPVFLAGPTAVGKSALALLLAKELSGEIVSVDSMQVYRGLDIGTAKPSPSERGQVPHHLIDVLDLTESFDAAQFIRLARSAVADIQSRGRRPILCGGTGLYFKAFVEGLGSAPPGDRALRAALHGLPLSDLLRELAERDPATYEKIDRQNPRRVIRAIEVIRLTGKPFSEQRAASDASPSTPGSPLPGANPPLPIPNAEPPVRHCAILLNRGSSDLHSRINSRVDAMFQAGLVAETEQLLQRGLEQNPTAMQALGYRQVVEHLRGQRSLPETIELVKIRTRQFAKRQLTWFRKQPKMTWLTLGADDLPSESLARLLSLIPG
jgi:tRNA dimethylallyltransferase